MNKIAVLAIVILLFSSCEEPRVEEGKTWELLHFTWTKGGVSVNEKGLFINDEVQFNLNVTRYPTEIGETNSSTFYWFNNDSSVDSNSPFEVYQARRADEFLRGALGDSNVSQEMLELGKSDFRRLAKMVLDGLLLQGWEPLSYERSSFNTLIPQTSLESVYVFRRLSNSPGGIPSK